MASWATRSSSSWTWRLSALSGGRVVAAGLLDDVLTDENLSATFGLPLAVQKRRGRYTAWLR